jgi:hypothetical protein
VLWLGVVLLGTGIAALFESSGRRAGLHHPLHRGSAESTPSSDLLHAGVGEVIAFAVLNIAGLATAV